MSSRPLRAKPLHLLEVGLRWPPETFLRWKLEGLAARGVRVTVASRSIIDRGSRLKGVELVELPQAGERPRPWAVRLRAVVALFASPRRLIRTLRRIEALPESYRERYGGRTGLLALYLPVLGLRPDVVHFEWNGAAALYLPMFDVWDCPVVTSCHGSDITVYPHIPGREHFASRLPEIFGRASAVHCVSESLMIAATELGLEPSKARVIRQGVDPELFRPGGEQRDPEVLELVSIAWLRWVKGFEWALVALRALIDSGVPARLTILGGASSPDTGETGERERILHTVADLGLEGAVRLTGEASSAEVSRHLRGSDALLVPSLDEGLPTVVLEAMACGVPVVATDCGGVSEALTDGVEGFLVPPREPEALAAALARLWRDRDLREDMGRAGRRTATSRFTLTRQIDEFLALYRELARA